MVDFLWFGLVGFGISWVFAKWLRKHRAKWEPHWDISVLGIATVGVAYTGLLMYLFAQFGVVPDTFASQREAMVWVLWRLPAMFLWTAPPMVYWGVKDYIGNLKRALQRSEMAGQTVAERFNAFIDAALNSQEDH